MKAKWFMPILAVSLVLLLLAWPASQNITESAQATKAATATGSSPAGKIRWDIMSVTGDNQGKAVFDVGAPAYATSYNSSMIKLTGSGTFGMGPSDPVTGGGKWVTYDYDENQTGNGTYKVMGLISWNEAPGTMPAEYALDKIGANEDIRSGVAIMTVAYTKEDGTSAGSGILIVSCRFVGSPASIVEGVAATMGVVSYLKTVTPTTGLDANHTGFHVIH